MRSARHNNGSRKNKRRTSRRTTLARDYDPCEGTCLCPQGRIRRLTATPNQQPTSTPIASIWGPREVMKEVLAFPRRGRGSLVGQLDEDLQSETEHTHR